jgi:hypothetical protein
VQKTTKQHFRIPKHGNNIIANQKHNYMNRYNIFNQIHKGMRAMLYSTGSLLQQTDFSIADEAHLTMQQLDELIMLFDKHADNEDNFVLPVLEQFEPAVTSLFEEEHVQDHALSNRLRKLKTMFEEAETDEERLETGNAIKLSFVEFMIFNLNHMAKEESVLNKLLWKYQTDEQIVSINHAIVAKTLPADMNRYAKWMVRGLNNAEIIHWLNEVRESSPEFVYYGLIEMVETDLPEPRKSTVLEQAGVFAF